MIRLYGSFRGTLVVASIAVLFTLVAPSMLQFFTIITLTQVIGLSILALSLALVWGFGGVLCFGQSAFFGIGAYAYSVAAGRPPISSATEKLHILFGNPYLLSLIHI